jgi:hypothetical protein
MAFLMLVDRCPETVFLIKSAKILQYSKEGQDPLHSILVDYVSGLSYLRLSSPFE